MSNLVTATANLATGLYGPFTITATPSPPILGGPFTAPVTVVISSAESPPGSAVSSVGPSINASPTPGTAGFGNLITISANAKVAVGGTEIAATGSVAALYYIGSTCFQKNTTNQWYGPITATDGGAAVADPHPLVTLSNSTISSALVAGGTVGTLAVAVGAGSYTWAWSLSGANAANFQLSGSILQISTALTPGSYAITLTATNGGIIGSPFTLTTAVTVANASGSNLFSVTGGQVIAPDGTVYIAKGININDVDIGTAMTSAAGGPMTTLFPGINFVRLACNSYGSVASYANFINWCTGFSPKIVVVLDQHQNFHANGTSAGTSGGGFGVVLTGTLLNTEQAWFTTMATAYASNPYVWYGTSNEPPGPGTHFVTSGADADQSLTSLSTWHQTTYTTIRAKAPNSMILFDLWGAGHPFDGSMTAAGVPVGQDYSNNGTGITTTPGPMTAAVYAAMHSVAWDWHQYGWMFGAQTGSVSQATIQASQQSIVTNLQAGFPCADGLMPVIAGEAGNSTTGASIDTSGEAVVLATIANVRKASGRFFGAAFWEWNNGGVLGDRLTSNGSPSWSLTSPYGTDVALFCARALSSF